jgi:hypothetical protein
MKTLKKVSKIETGKHTVNLLEFYKKVNPLLPLCLFPDFKTIVDEAISDGVLIEIDETFFEYQNDKTITDDNAMAELNETVIDLTTATGRLEMRKRLGTLVVFLQKQSTGNVENIIIGYTRTSTGFVSSVSVNWCLACFAFGLWHWRGRGRSRFWSRNGDV